MNWRLWLHDLGWFLAALVAIALVVATVRALGLVTIALVVVTVRAVADWWPW